MRPKFCVGEEVYLVPEAIPGLRMKCEVVKVEQGNFLIKRTHERHSGWWYRISPDPEQKPDTRWFETALRKLPPEERTQWEDTIFQPNRDEVAA